MLSFFFFSFFFFCFIFILVLPREGEVRGTSVPLVCLRKHYVLPLHQGKKKRGSDGGKTGEENLLGMGFCSVENCQLGCLL